MNIAVNRNEIDLRQLNLLERYLIDHRITHERYDTYEEFDDCGELATLDRHEICVPEEGEECRWTAVCQIGSYGADEGLLEIFGDIVDEDQDGDWVVGMLTADDVIRRLEEYY